MVRPCPKCGETRTDSVHHGVIYGVAKMFGYRLRICARCGRKQFVPGHSKDLAHRAGEDNQATNATDIFGEKAPKAVVCPRCGKSDFRRSRRRFWERIIGRGPMVRCRICRRRFQLPEERDSA